MTDPVATLDLAATFHDYTGTAAPAEIQRRSLRPLLEGRRDIRDVAYSEWRLQPIRCGVALDLRIVRTATHKLTVELNSGEGEMYHLADDPNEIVNVWKDPGHARARRELEDMIRARPGRLRDRYAEPVGIYGSILCASLGHRP